MSAELKYGQIRGGEQGFEVTVAANQVFFATSAKFVKRTGLNTATVTLATATDTEIMGHIETEELNSSDGTEVRKCINDPGAIFRVPVVGGTYANKYRGRKVDIKVSSSIQGVALDSATYGQLVIVDGDATDNSWVDVRINRDIATLAPAG